jgi:hypothetical protein
MKKLTVMIVIIFAMITLGSVCGAGDKTGDMNVYVVKETFQFEFVDYSTPGNPRPWGLAPRDDSWGRVSCANNDIVTGCSYSLQSYPGYTRLSDYAFLNVIPIDCSPDLKDKDTGKAVCRGCLVTLTAIHPDPPPSTESPTDGTFRVYAYCAKH